MLKNWGSEIPVPALSGVELKNLDNMQKLLHNSGFDLIYLLRQPKFHLNSLKELFLIDHNVDSLASLVFSAAIRNIHITASLRMLVFDGASGGRGLIHLTLLLGGGGL